MKAHTSHTVVVDSDALFALFNKDDANHTIAESYYQKLFEQKTRLIFPSTTIVETIDTLQRKLKKHEEAIKVAELISQSQFALDSVEDINGKYLKEAVLLFKLKYSNTNTLADAIVAAVAKNYNAQIFSFDNWFRKLGFILIPDIY